MYNVELNNVCIVLYSHLQKSIKSIEALVDGHRVNIKKTRYKQSVALLIDTESPSTVNLNKVQTSWKKFTELPLSITKFLFFCQFLSVRKFCMNKKKYLNLHVSCSTKKKEVFNKLLFLFNSLGNFF